jgi:hypothetical protein
LTPKHGAQHPHFRFDRSIQHWQGLRSIS